MKWEGCRIYDVAVKNAEFLTQNEYANQDVVKWLRGQLEKAQVVKVSAEQLSHITELEGHSKQLAYRAPFTRTFVEFDDLAAGDQETNRGLVGFFSVDNGEELEIWPILRFAPDLGSGLFLYARRFQRHQDGTLTSNTGIAVLDNLFEEPNKATLEAQEKLLRVTGEFATALTELLQSSNIALNEEPVSRQVRRKAKRENAKIPLVVTVKRSGPSIARGGKVDYSHQFPVRGHFRYTTCGSKFEACPADKLVPRPGDQVLAVKEWVSPYVKGPKDKPYVPKVLDTRWLVGATA